MGSGCAEDDGSAVVGAGGDGVGEFFGGFGGLGPGVGVVRGGAGFALVGPGACGFGFFFPGLVCDEDPLPSSCDGEAGPSPSWGRSSPDLPGPAEPCCSSPAPPCPEPPPPPPVTAEPTSGASPPRRSAECDGLAPLASSSSLLTLIHPALAATARAAAARRTGTYMARTGSHLRGGDKQSPCPTPAARKRTRRPKDSFQQSYFNSRRYGPDPHLTRTRERAAARRRSRSGERSHEPPSLPSRPRRPPATHTSAASAPGRW